MSNGRYHNQNSNSHFTSMVPDWEKEFCRKVGGMKWKNFLNRKQYTADYYRDILEWDDSAGKESFDNAKNRFYSEFFKSPSITPPLNPDKYIDQINWNAKVNPELYLGLEKALEYQEPEQVIIRLEDIIPTGWDDCQELDKPAVLTGMIVGDNCEEDGAISCGDSRKIMHSHNSKYVATCGENIKRKVWQRKEKNGSNTQFQACIDT